MNQIIGTISQKSNVIFANTGTSSSSQQTAGHTSTAFDDVMRGENFSSAHPTPAPSRVSQVVMSVDKNMESNMYVLKNPWYDQALKLGTSADAGKHAKERDGGYSGQDPSNCLPQQYLSGKTPKGNSVEIIQGRDDAQGVYTVRVTGRDGSEFLFNTEENTSIQERSDGGLNVTLQDSGKRYILSSDGTMREAGEEEFGETTADDILINVNGNSVDGGDGDDLIFNFADNATILGGKGNDTVVLGNDVKNLSVNTGDGDDTVRGALAENTEINLGNGNDHIKMDLLIGSRVDAGAGDNTMEVRQIREGSSIIAGNGDNVVNIQQMGVSSSITAGNGNNNILVSDMDGQSSIDLGNGNNNVSLHMEYGGTVVVGNGNNTLNVDHFAYGSITLGNGNNSLTSWWLKNTQLVMGNGNNFVDVSSAQKDTSITGGNGENFMNIDMVEDAIMSLGDGNNSVKNVSLRESSSIRMGNGNNVFASEELADESTMVAGTGKNLVGVGTVAPGATLTVGDKAQNQLIAEALGRATSTDNSASGQSFAVQKRRADATSSGNFLLDQLMQANSILNNELESRRAAARSSARG